MVDAALLSEQVIAIAFVAMHVHHHSQQGGDLQGGSQATLIGSLQARPQTRDAAADLVRIGQGLRPPETCRNGNVHLLAIDGTDRRDFLLPFSPELGAAILSGRVDYARALDPATARKAATVPGMSTARFYQSVIHATWVNAKRPPFDDPRVRRALHLLCEKQVLVDVVKDVSPLMMGGFIYPFSEFATPKDQLAKRIGYQDDAAGAIKEAKSLLAAPSDTLPEPESVIESLQ